MEPFERQLRQRGAQCIAGLDEVGRGALFGPVVAAAVVLDPRRQVPRVRDSKQLSARQREELFRCLRHTVLDWAVGLASAAEIDRINILRATRLAMTRALGGLRRRPDHLLIDALDLPGVSIAQTAIVKGDGRCRSIAAASIMAKVVRDALLRGYARNVRGYGLARNKGYGTAAHRQAILQLGWSQYHRRSFRVQGMLPLAQEVRGD